MGFKNSELIYIVGDDTYYISNIQELNEIVLGKTNSEEQKKIRMIEIAKILSYAYNIDIISLKEIKEFSDILLKHIIIDDEIIYYTTLAKNGLITLYEREDANIFLKKDILENENNNNTNQKYKYYNVGENAENIIKQYMIKNNNR